MIGITQPFPELRDLFEPIKVVDVVVGVGFGGLDDR